MDGPTPRQPPAAPYRGIPSRLLRGKMASWAERFRSRLAGSGLGYIRMPGGGDANEEDGAAEKKTVREGNGVWERLRGVVGGSSTRVRTGGLGLLLVLLVWGAGRRVVCSPFSVVFPGLPSVGSPPSPEREESDAGESTRRAALTCQQTQDELDSHATPTSFSAQYLHVLLPAAQPAANLCKTLVSASALRYPTPTLLVGAENSTARGALAVDAVLRYLAAFPRARDQDLVLLLGARHVWLQLRPEVLLERYFAVAAAADARLARRLGRRAVQAESIRQRILFAAPEGRLDAAVGIGELGAVRRLFARAQQDRVAGGGEEAFFADLLRAQERQRELIRARYLSPAQRLWWRIKAAVWGGDGDGDGPSSPTPRPPFEYGIGLDDARAISHVAAADAAWVRFADAAMELPDDVSRSLAPFWSQNPAEDRLPPATTPWSRTTLRADRRTGAVPALIVAGARAHAEWPRLWLQPHARALMDAHVQEPYRAVATLRTGARETSWWGVGEGKFGFRTDEVLEGEEVWKSWGEVCGGVDGGVEIEEEVFRDGKGAWRVPRFNY
ncbi:hypothetical protein JHW43_009193 [Diplocarpon mali]|nr:hypothetical protein JHW43_009193 [Diplocarpon mali]